MINTKLLREENFLELGTDKTLKINSANCNVTFLTRQYAVKSYAVLEQIVTYDYEIPKKKSNLSIYDDDQIISINVLTNDPNIVSSKLTIMVPEVESLSKVNVTLDKGDVSFQKKINYDSVSVTTMFGDIVVDDDMNCATLKTDVGNVFINSNVKDLYIKMGRGDLCYNHVEGKDAKGDLFIRHGTCQIATNTNSYNIKYDNLSEKFFTARTKGKELFELNFHVVVRKGYLYIDSRRL